MKKPVIGVYLFDKYDVKSVWWCPVNLMFLLIYLRLRFKLVGFWLLPNMFLLFIIQGIYHLKYKSISKMIQ